MQHSSFKLTLRIPLIRVIEHKSPIIHMFKSALPKHINAHSKHKTIIC